MVLALSVRYSHAKVQMFHTDLNSMLVGCFPGIGGLIGLLAISRIPAHKYSLVGCAWALNCLGAPTVLNWGLPGMNIAGHTKRSTMMGMYFMYVLRRSPLCCSYI